MMEGARTSLVVFTLTCCNLAQAQDKSSYNLFNPVPRESMRPLSADRPDVTESPYTVDAGHFQLEMSFVDYTQDGDNVATQMSVAPMNLKAGLLNNVDLQLVVEPFIQVDGDEINRASGFGDTQLRLKINLWGDDAGDTAFAVMPFIQFPTASDDAVGAGDHLQGGVIAPLAVALPHDWGLGLMAEVDFVRDEADDGYGFEFVHTATLGHDIVGPLAGYVEYVGIAPHDTGGTYLAFAGAGLTYGLNDNVQLDAGVNVGISEHADDLNLFTGITWRL